MCLTLPFKIRKIQGNRAELSDGRNVNIAGIENLVVGDWVLANADLAVSKVSEKEAEEIKNYFQ